MKPTAEQLLASIQSMAPDVSLESAGQTVLAEALRTCTNIEQLTKLPVTPKTLDVLLEAGYLGTDDWERLTNLLDPK